ncbi:hypothetical protein V8D89_004947 [Ganoderma adspersum]
MSSSSPSLPPVGLSEFQTLIVSRYFGPAIAVLAIYECSLTFAEEVEYFWGAPRTGAVVVYYLNKYILMFMYVTAIVGLASPSASAEATTNGPSSCELPRSSRALLPVCAKGSRIGFVVSLLPYPVSAAFSAMRMFALTGKNCILTVIVLVLSIVPVPINLIVYHFGIDAANVPLIGCIPIDRTPIPLGKQEVIITRTCLIAADILLIVATWTTLYRRAGPSRERRRATLADVLLHDGTMYFFGLLVLNALMLVFTLENVDIMYGMNSSDVVVFTQSMSAILLHRFLLHLQSANRRTLAVSSEGSEGEQDVTYASMEFGGAEVSRGSTLALEGRCGSAKVI